MKNKVSRLIRDEGGAITVMTVIMIVAFLGILAVVIDLGHLHTVQNELRNAADACALRGARGFVPDNIPPNVVYKADPDSVNAKQEAYNTIEVNKSDNKAFILGDLPLDDIQAGIWDYEARNWVPGTTDEWSWPPDESWWGKKIGPGVGLPTKRAASMSQGPVSMTLAALFSFFKDDPTVPIKVEATAALSGATASGPILPFGTMVPPPEPTDPPSVWTGWFKIDNADTVGWSNLQGVPEGEKPPPTDVKEIWGLLDGTITADAGGDHPIVSINNGQAASALSDKNKRGMTAPGNRFGLTNDPLVTGSTDPDVYKPDSANAANEYLIPVFDKVNDDANKFNQAAAVGVVAVHLVEVGVPPLNYVKVEFLPGTYIVPGTGGGPWYGVLATKPRLVK